MRRMTMKQYLVSSLDSSKFNLLITLLDYNTQISSSLKKVKVSGRINERLLIDAALCSGVNEYRFMEIPLKENGRLMIDEYKYVSVDDATEEEANKILKGQIKYLKNSILPDFQIDEILN